MDLRKKESLLRSTESGQASWVAGLWFMLFLWAILCVLLQVGAFSASAQYMEDALAVSNLAAAVIDLEEYGISHRLLVADPEEAYERYLRALGENLGLDAEWECGNKALISGPVRVENFTVYNVADGAVEAYCFSGSGALTHLEGSQGELRAPNGISVENTGIYSEISYPIRGVFGLEVWARKGKLVDLARYEAEP